MTPIVHIFEVILLLSHSIWTSNGTVTMVCIIKWGPSSRWSIRPNSAWGSMERTTIGKMHHTLYCLNCGIKTFWNDRLFMIIMVILIQRIMMNLLLFKWSSFIWNSVLELWLAKVECKCVGISRKRQLKNFWMAFYDKNFKNVRYLLVAYQISYAFSWPWIEPKRAGTDF